MVLLGACCATHSRYATQPRSPCHPPPLPPYQVEPDGVLRGLRSLRAAGTPARTLILDDGWQTVTPPEAATADGGDGGGGEGGGGVNAANAAAPPPLPLLARIAARASAALLGALSAILQATPPYRATSLHRATSPCRAASFYLERCAWSLQAPSEE